MSSRAPLPCLAAVAGLTAQLVVLVMLTVDLAHHAATLDPEREADDLVDGVLLTLFGPFVYGVAAVVVGLLALVLLVTLLLSFRAGSGRLTGLILGLVLQVPVVGFSIMALREGPDVRAVTVIVGGALMLLAAVVPGTWRWCRQPTPVRAADVAPAS